MIDYEKRIKYWESWMTAYSIASLVVVFIAISVAVGSLIYSENILSTLIYYFICLLPLLLIESMQKQTKLWIKDNREQAKYQDELRRQDEAREREEAHHSS